jgi:hypothetical protein
LCSCLLVTANDLIGSTISCVSSGSIPGTNRQQRYHPPDRTGPLVFFSSSDADCWFRPALYRKSNLCVPGKVIAWLQSQFLHSCVCERFIYIPRIGLHIWQQQNRQTKYPQIYKCGNWETEHHNSVLEITRLHSTFLERHKWEPDIYTGFSPALHLQCGTSNTVG